MLQEKHHSQSIYVPKLPLVVYEHVCHWIKTHHWLFCWILFSWIDIFIKFGKEFQSPTYQTWTSRVLQLHAWVVWLIQNNTHPPPPPPSIEYLNSARGHRVSSRSRWWRTRPDARRAAREGRPPAPRLPPLMDFWSAADGMVLVSDVRGV